MRRVRRVNSSGIEMSTDPNFAGLMVFNGNPQAESAPNDSKATSLGRRRRRLQRVSFWDALAKNTWWVGESVWSSPLASSKALPDSLFKPFHEAPAGLANCSENTSCPRGIGVYDTRDLYETISAFQKSEVLERCLPGYGSENLASRFLSHFEGLP